MSSIDFALTVVLPALSGAGAGGVLLYFFGQRFVDHRLKKDLECYRVELADLAIFFDNDTYLKLLAYAKASMNATAEYLDSLLPLVAQQKFAEEILAMAEEGRPALKKLFEEEMKPKAMELAGIFRAQLGVERKGQMDLAP